ncbi:MAG: hypothetical protein U1E42_12270 [Rhodospirillales bacterium]
MMGDAHSLGPQGKGLAAVSAGTTIRVSYRRSESPLRPDDGHPLASIDFGGQGGDASPERIMVPLPLIGAERWTEVWSVDRPVTTLRSGDLVLRGNDDVVFGVIHLPSDDDIEGASFHAYERILEELPSDGALHMIRTWNFFSRIHDRVDGLERYGLFCRGRHRALADHLVSFEKSLPAASAIGTHVPGLLVCFLACRGGGVQIENPRQISAFHYPPAYAPKSPSFSRSILRQGADGRYRLFVSGTAAIVGHLSRHPSDLIRQLEETCENLSALLASASVRAGERLVFELLRVYLRTPQDADPLRAVLTRRLGTVPLVFLRGDICRRDLLVEVEGVAESGAGTDASTADP